MIDKNVVIGIVLKWLKDKEYFLVDVTVSNDDKIVVEIDHAEGVWIDDCVELSRFIESRLKREDEDYELEVGSSGIGQPFKVKQQYVAHKGHKVEVTDNKGRKHIGILTEADDERFTLMLSTKIKSDRNKRPKWTEQPITFAYDEIKQTKYLISFK